MDEARRRLTYCLFALEPFAITRSLYSELGEWCRKGYARVLLQCDDGNKNDPFLFHLWIFKTGRGWLGGEGDPSWRMWDPRTLTLRLLVFPFPSPSLIPRISILLFRSKLTIAVPPTEWMYNRWRFTVILNPFDG